MKLSKLLKKLPPDVLSEVDTLNEDDLHKLVVACENNITQATEERNANSKFQEAKEIMKDFNAGLRDAKNFQQAKIAYSLIRIKELNGEDLGEMSEVVSEIRNTSHE